MYYELDANNGFREGYILLIIKRLLHLMYELIKFFLCINKKFLTCFKTSNMTIKTLPMTCFEYLNDRSLYFKA